MRMANLEYVRWRARQCTRYARAVSEPEVANVLSALARDLDEFADAGERRLAHTAAANSAAGLIRTPR